MLLGPVGVLLQSAGAVTATAGAHRLWRTGHWLRVPYAGLAALVDLTAVIVLAGMLR